MVEFPGRDPGGIRRFRAEISGRDLRSGISGRNLTHVNFLVNFFDIGISRPNSIKEVPPSVRIRSQSANSLENNLANNESAVKKSQRGSA